MSRIVTWNRLPGLLTLALVGFVAACEAPTSPARDASDPADLFSYQAKKTGLKPAVNPQCPEDNGDGRVLCRVEVNVKHGNDKGLPVNLKGIRNAAQYDKKGNGATLPVSVLGTTQFDLSAIYMGTVRLGDVATVPSLTPVNTVGNGDFQASIVDLNGDGILDLLLHFSIPAMVANNDLSETTTELCLYGEGPGYVINGCFGGDDDDDGDGDDNGGGDGEWPDYALLDDCSFKLTGVAKGYRCAIVQLFGRDGAFSATVLQMSQFSPDGNDPGYGYPDWASTPVETLLATDSRWSTQTMPFGTDNSNSPWYFGDAWDGLPGTFLAETCGLTPSEYRWGIGEQLLVRADMTIPAEAQAVKIEFLVDDAARVFFNGTELTRDWMTSGADGTCVTYGRTITLDVPPELLNPGGVNQLGVWTSDSGRYVNYLDVRVFAEVPQFP